MSECCTSAVCENKSQAAKPICPACRHKGTHVGVKTIMQHLRQPWLYPVPEDRYYFCSQPDCDVVYFSSQAALIKKSELRTRVGVKEQSNDALICYCFGVTKAEANKETKDFVIGQTKAGMCTCDTSNPSGRCCLKDFP